MDVFTAFRQRRSVRAYKAVEVEEEKLKKILEAARLSPSASNRQDWKFIVARNKETKKKLAKAGSDNLSSGEHLLSLLPAVRNQKRSWLVVSPHTQWTFPLPAHL